jgi:protein SDA1
MMQNQIKEKKHHGPKAKGGGTTNEEKNKKKPLMMVRFKKYKEKHRVDNVKKKIKKIKVQLGHVRSGKQAQRLKKRRLG